MRNRAQFDLPAELQPIYARAKRLEWMTIGFMITIVVVMFLGMGGSQAMKAAWIEDILSFVPPIAFLIAARFSGRPANDRFPYGYHRSVSIAFLAGSVALAIFGVYILLDSIIGLVRREHVSIGTVVLLGHHFWAGWLMIAALIYSAIPPMILGHMKQKPAHLLHDKTLMADSDMNRADWLTAGAGVAGIVGIGLGWWWADSAAAGIISLDIVKDGVTNLKHVIRDLMDEQPTEVDGERSDVPEQVRAALLALPWIRAVDLRMREEGHVFAGEVFLEVSDATDLPEKLKEARRVAHGVDWRVRDVVFEIEGSTRRAAEA